MHVIKCAHISLPLCGEITLMGLYSYSLVARRALLRVKRQHRQLIAANQQERRHVARQHLQPRHVQRRRDGVLARHRQRHYHQRCGRRVLQQQFAQPQLPIGLLLQRGQLRVGHIATGSATAGRFAESVQKAAVELDGVDGWLLRHALQHRQRGEVDAELGQKIGHATNKEKRFCIVKTLSCTENV